MTQIRVGTYLPRRCAFDNSRDSYRRLVIPRRLLAKETLTVEPLRFIIPRFFFFHKNFIYKVTENAPRWLHVVKGPYTLEAMISLCITF